ncbi:hypothetical protein BWQ96_08511 [Gracilariopsis chorda]|uniref:Uncharacterized protein n=1 Tax=Gracilariopsis chorda TaxID=448386 RepID=A0A2V3II64_9FLOR|nr:hypothetical protein BWQ96_08511 [Gracilariopsis chorda]|eukprot:PXF41761.1 hypothetical protein BWQ96_08511 [Gracilariopsis chorda]
MQEQAKNMKVFLSLTLFALFSLSYAASYPRFYSPTDLSVAVKASQVSTEVFRCDSSNAIHRALCRAALNKVNSELEGAGISIDRNGVLFVYDDPSNRKIQTGKSCSVTAEQRHQHLEARFKRSARLRLKGNSLTEPFVLRLKLPVTLSGRVDIKQRFGAKVPQISSFKIRMKCKNYASDSYSLKGSLSTNANMGIGFYLKPSLGTVASGDYAIVLQPIVRVVTKLESTDIRLDASGVSPIAAVWSSVVGWTSTLTQVADAALNGKSITAVIERNVAWDVGSAVVLGIGSLPAPLEKLLWKLLSTVGEFLARKKARGYGEDIEDDLNKKVRRALNVGSDGKRVIIIKRNFMEMLRKQGENENVFVRPPTNPTADCMTGVNYMCSICRGCSQCVSERNRCRAQQRAVTQKWTPKNLIHSVPKIAALARPSPNPKPAPRGTVQDRDACYRRAHSVCAACRGCGECRYLISQCDRIRI